MSLNIVKKMHVKKFYSRYIQSNVVTRLTFSLLPETVIAKLNATQVPVLKIQQSQSRIRNIFLSTI